MGTTMSDSVISNSAGEALWKLDSQDTRPFSIYYNFCKGLCEPLMVVSKVFFPLKLDSQFRP
jgi:hypothetical protein